MPSSSQAVAARNMATSACRQVFADGEETGTPGALRPTREIELGTRGHAANEDIALHRERPMEVLCDYQKTWPRQHPPMVFDFGRGRDRRKSLSMVSVGKTSLIASQCSSIQRRELGVMVV